MFLKEVLVKNFYVSVETSLILYRIIGFRFPSQGIALFKMRKRRIEIATRLSVQPQSIIKLHAGLVGYFVTVQ